MSLQLTSVWKVLGIQAQGNGINGLSDTSGLSFEQDRDLEICIGAWAPVWLEMDIICCLPTYSSLKKCYDCLGTFRVEQRWMLYKQLTSLGHFLRGPQIVMVIFV